MHNVDYESFLDITINNGSKDIALLAVQIVGKFDHPSPELFLVEGYRMLLKWFWIIVLLPVLHHFI